MVRYLGTKSELLFRRILGKYPEVLKITSMFGSKPSPECRETFGNLPKPSPERGQTFGSLPKYSLDFCLWNETVYRI